MKVTLKVLNLIGGLSAIIGLLAGTLGSFGYALKIKDVALPILGWTEAGVLTAIGILLIYTEHLISKNFSGSENASTSNEATNLPMNDLGFISNTIKRTRNRSLMLGIFSSLLAALLTLVNFFSDQNEINSAGSISLLTLAFLCLLLGIVGFIKYFENRVIESSGIYKLIMLTPSKISELKAIVLISRGNISINAQLVSGNRTKAVLNVSEIELELLKQYLRKHNPQLAYEVMERKI